MMRLRAETGYVPCGQISRRRSEISPAHHAVVLLTGVLLFFLQHQDDDKTDVALMARGLLFFYKFIFVLPKNRENRAGAFFGADGEGWQDAQGSAEAGRGVFSWSAGSPGKRKGRLKSLFCRCGVSVDAVGVALEAAKEVSLEIAVVFHVAAQVMLSSSVVKAPVPGGPG